MRMIRDSLQSPEEIVARDPKRIPSVCRIVGYESAFQNTCRS